LILEQLESHPSYNYLSLTQFAIERRDDSEMPLRLLPIKKALLDRVDLSVLAPVYRLLGDSFDSTQSTTSNSQQEQVTDELSYRFSSSLSFSNSLSTSSSSGMSSLKLSFQNEIFCQVFTPLLPVLS
jgi:hypothetical protein